MCIRDSTLLALRALFALRTLWTGGALQCMDVGSVGGQQLGDFLSGSAILASGALLTLLALRALFALWTLRTGGALQLSLIHISQPTRPD